MRAKKGAAMLEVRKARADEIDAVLDFYAKMIDGMQGTDFDVQWRHDGHPSKDFLREAVADGQMIVGVLEGEGIASAMVVNHEGEPATRRCRGAWTRRPRAWACCMWWPRCRPTTAAASRASFCRAAWKSPAPTAFRSCAWIRSPTTCGGRGLYESCGFADKGEWTVYYPALGDIQVIMYELAL